MSSDNRNQSFDSNEYVRPNDNWRCGGALDGLPCTRGPSAGGDCGAPCVPFKIGDRYYCNNAAKLYGRCDDGPLPDGSCCHDPPECTPVQQPSGYVCNRGACVDGPLPDGTCSRRNYVCHPVRTVKAQRWLVTTSVLGAALGLALWAIGGPGNQVTVSPGNVASVHQAVADKCSACHHVSDDGGAVEIVEASVSGRSATAQNVLCLSCHQEFDHHDRLPHTTSVDSLTQVTASAQTGGLFVEATRALFQAPEELACANCHREHHGADNDLTEIADAQCQLCHTRRFHSFAEDHPPFTDYPLSGRSEIYFDHSTHYGGHFTDYSRTAPAGHAPGDIEAIAEASSVTCDACHKEDDSGAYMIDLGYEAMCASCHDGQIWDLSMPPMPVLSQTFPVEAERAAYQTWGLERGPFDLPPIMHLLLAGDERFADAYLKLQTATWQSAAELVEGSSPEVASLSAAVVDLLQALGDDPRGTITERLAAVGGDRLSEAQIRRLARTTANANFVANVRRMAEQLAAPQVPPAGTQTESAAATASVSSTGPPAAGWSFDGQSGVLSYRPREHADSTMREWTEAAAAILTPQHVASVSTDGERAEHDAVYTAAEYFVRPIAAGRCVKCHTVDRFADRLQVNWYAKHHAVGSEELTFFRHAPHIVMLPGEDQCMTCHKLQAETAMFRSEFAAGDRISIDPSPGAACGFPQISGAAACASCHHRTGASQRCTTCHHYHARRPASDAVSPRSL